MRKLPNIEENRASESKVFISSSDDVATHVQTVIDEIEIKRKNDETMITGNCIYLY